MSITLPNLVPMINELVTLPSVSCTDPRIDQGNLAVIERLAEWLEALGFSVEIMHLQHDRKKANLIATLGQGPGGLVFSGHSDTVPFDEGKWDSNPLAIDERDSKLYGLGSCDMKGFFPIAIEAAKAFLDAPLQQPLIILATADEEASMSGAKALARLGRPKARYAVIGEPTSLRPIYMHKGMMMSALDIHGQAGHSSDPSLGANALEAMYDAIKCLLQERQQLQADYQNQAFKVTTPTMNLGCIHGGDNPNRICGHAQLQFDFRALPGMTNDQVHERLKSALRPVSHNHNVNVDLAPLFDPIPPFAEQADSELLKIASKLTGYEPETVAFCTEAPFLKQLGMETIIMGPGSIDQAHQPNEFMALDQIQPAINTLKALIKRFCL